MKYKLLNKTNQNARKKIKRIIKGSGRVNYEIINKFLRISRFVRFTWIGSHTKRKPLVTC